ncbi:penicillin acylase family protein [Pedobacter insulae]|uniref:Acyl-homoserine lactone (AHL) acylase PvdQ n=1 Tax=Pedobacter insulae TaxID=414048 RepID=A0A1I2TDR7_9SPHI|nr:penicillin acylase family protein [Pedobacter insulae]SFG63032.1 Acyl-homoserine lactone (AHL) acylase PvdQ [Pedobacter insulae]
MKSFLLFLFLPLSLFAQNFSATEIASYQKQAKQVTIIRDNWGIPHVYGKTDADAVFGLLYAQCEDDFKRIELNYIEKLGRLSEINGEKDIFNDLQIRLLIDSTAAIADYQKAQPWLKSLLNAQAAAINFYLHTHPAVKPALLKRFKPWYPLLWTDGSIGAINTANLTIGELKKFYSGDYTPTAYRKVIKDQQSGSNGFAFAPSITESGNAILYINPHTTFYFRPEVQMQSEQGLNAYGAVTWGQFFIYQGFNEFCGWMHTSNNVDIADMYAEKVSKTAKGLFYEYDKKLLPVGQKKVSIKYLDGKSIKTKQFNTYFTKNGPIMAIRDGKWISLKSKNRNTASLIQSWVRTKAKSFEDYQKAMDLKANASNNTVYADAKGNIAYWHGNFIPIRDPKFNWGNVVDGSTSATAWKGLHPVKESVHIYNPVNGWLQNCNSTPFSVAGANSPKKENYPPYMAPDGENFRGVNAVRLLNQPTKYNIDKVIATGYDTYLSAFAVLVPALVNAYEQLPQSDPLLTELKEPLAVLKAWDYRCNENSIASTLAFDWAQLLIPNIQRVYIDQGEKDQVQNTIEFAAKARPNELLDPLKAVVTNLTKRYGKWDMPWGEVNRFQRLTGAINEKYDDALPSIPVGFGSAMWGQLPSYRSGFFKTNKRYGTSGNSFVCVVEFGSKIKAKSILAGGNSGDPTSKHFNDQALMYSKGQFKEVLFYKEDVLKNAERTYQPGL